MFHDRIKQRAQQLGVKNRVLAALVGISAPRLSLYLKGCCELKPGKPEALNHTLNALNALKDCFPIPLGMDDAKALETALERLREKSSNGFED